jgi:hypothetical protein
MLARENFASPKILRAKALARFLRYRAAPEAASEENRIYQELSSPSRSAFMVPGRDPELQEYKNIKVGRDARSSSHRVIFASQLAFAYCLAHRYQQNILWH